MTTLGWLITHTFVATIFLLIGHSLGEKRAKEEQKEIIEKERFDL